MFYAHFVLAKKGPLARIWLAAHWDKKLTKAHVFETNIESSVEGILQPKVKMALRTSGHLLLGIVRIYSRKAKYLLADCNEAFIKIKMAFRPGMVDLPEGNREAAVATITLPEVFHDFDTAMPDITIDMDAQVTLNQSRAEDITLKEDYGTLSLMTDDGFDDMGFDDPEVVRDATNIDDGFDHTNLLLCEDPSKEQLEDGAQNATSSSIGIKANVSLDAPLKDDGFGGTVGEGLLDGETGGLFEPAGLFDDAPLGHDALGNNTSELNAESSEHQIEKPTEHHDDSEDDLYDMGPGSMGAPSPPSSPQTPGPILNDDVNAPGSEYDLGHGSNADCLGIDATQISSTVSNAVKDMAGLPNDMPPPSALPDGLDQTTLINNEDESFALAPLDATVTQGAERTVKTKRKRKLIVDEVKNISGEEMKTQLSDTTDVVSSLDLAPPTKRLMHWKEIGGVEKLFALPGYTILSKSLSRAYQRHLTTKSIDNEDCGFEEDTIDLDGDLGQGRDEEAIARKRRKEMESMLPQDLSHLDSLHLDSSRTPFLSDTSRPTFLNETSRPSFHNPSPRPSFHNASPRPSFHNASPRPSFHNEALRSPFRNETSRALFANEVSRTSYPNENSRAQYPNETSRPNYPNEISRQSYSSDHGMSHPSLDVPNFMQSQHHLFSPLPTHQMSDQPQQQLMSNAMSSVMSHPPPAHMIHQMLQNDVNPLAHLPQMMHPMMDQGPSLHSITPSIHNVSSPAVSEAYSQAVHHSVIEPVSQHLLSDSITHMHQTSIDKQMPSHSLDEPINHQALQTQLSQNAVNHMPCVENDLDSCSEGQLIQPHIDNQVLQNNIDDDLTQPCLEEEYTQTQVVAESNPLPTNMSNALSHNDHANASSVNEQEDQNALQNCSVQSDPTQQATEPQTESNLFDTLSNGEIHPQENQLAAALQNKSNEFPVSDDDDDYGAPSSVGPVFPEEQMADETYEQFEERILTKRTVHMLHVISNKLDSDQSVSFGGLVKGHKRKQVAQKFYTFLVLKKQQAVELQQDSTYGDLVITKGPKFNAVYNSN